MIEEDIDEILLTITEEFIKPQNKKQLDHQKLASSLFNTPIAKL